MTYTVIEYRKFSENSLLRNVLNTTSLKFNNADPVQLRQVDGIYIYIGTNRNVPQYIHRRNENFSPPTLFTGIKGKGWTFFELDTANCIVYVKSHCRNRYINGVIFSVVSGAGTEYASYTSSPYNQYTSSPYAGYSYSTTGTSGLLSRYLACIFQVKIFAVIAIIIQFFGYRVVRFVGNTVYFLYIGILLNSKAGQVNGK